MRRSILFVENLDSNKIELKDAERIAHDYLHTDPSHRDLDTPIIKTKQMHEPIHFIGFFGPWDRNYWTVRIFIHCQSILVSLVYSRNHPMKKLNRVSMRTIVQKFTLN